MLTALAIVAGASLVAWVLQHGRAADRFAARAEASQSRQLMILEAFAPGIAAANADPQALVVWQPLALTARRLFPEEFAAIDRAHGGTFPFSQDTIRQAHARWTTDWLTWERSHDVEYKRRAAAARADAGLPAAAMRAALDVIENEKLELYQRRYAEYADGEGPPETHRALTPRLCDFSDLVFQTARGRKPLTIQEKTTIFAPPSLFVF
jgi:hypothetical protein